jgi:hypothetical protein
LSCGKGIGLKTDDLAICFACSGCHDWLDRSRDDLERIPRFLAAHIETLRVLYDTGVLKI